MVLFIEGPRGAFGKLEGLSVNRHEEISCAARNHLARQTVAQASHEWRPFALVADFAAVASAGKCKFGRAHSISFERILFCLTVFIVQNPRAKG